jgi:hypothetical protein
MKAFRYCGPVREIARGFMAKGLGERIVKGRLGHGAAVLHVVAR